MARSKTPDVAADIIKTTEEEHDAQTDTPKRRGGEKLPEGMKKDQRVTFLLRTNEWKKLNSYANLKGTRPNTIINDFIHQLIEDNADLIERYEALTQEAQDR